MSTRPEPRPPLAPVWIGDRCATCAEPVTHVSTSADAVPERWKMVASCPRGHVNTWLWPLPPAHKPAPPPDGGDD